MTQYLYVGAGLDAAAVFATDSLAGATGRHQVTLDPGPLEPVPDPRDALAATGVAGVVIAAQSGVVERARLRLAKTALRRGLPVWLYWPREGAVEFIDRDRLRSYARLRRAVVVLERAGRPFLRLVDASTRLKSGLRWIYRGAALIQPGDVDQIIVKLEAWSRAARAVPFERDGSRSAPCQGPGLYLRTDFWNQIVSGGSYGHTCYVAKELAAAAARFACLVPHRYDLLDALGVFQAPMDPPDGPVSENTMIAATPHYYPIVRTACKLLQPAYIYERLCLGNWTAALLSGEMGIPYIVEYNGSEITMHRSRNNTVPVYTDVYIKAEEFAFRQATAISVVSEHVRDDLVRRGIDARKILVNPNGADLDQYAPPPAEQKRAVRRSLGFGDDRVVVGFTGTFGWWHGIDVLAEAMPRICAQAPRVDFLLIGDGNLKHVIDLAVERHGLQSRVVSVGSVAQQEGARLLKACDIYVSPHSRHMTDGKFFGSPTKIFEYMAMGAGIVASDLEQIGEVLSPAIRPDALARDGQRVTDERAVLCTPGDVDEFIAAVVGLARRPDIACALGRNARRAVVADFSWRRHVERLWAFIDRLARDADAEHDERVLVAQPHTPEWFAEIERTRYTRAPWLQAAISAAAKSGQRVLDIGAGLGTDAARFAAAGADVSAVDLSAANVAVAEKQFDALGLTGKFLEWNGRTLPFADRTFDLVYSNHLDEAPSHVSVVEEIYRVLKPGGCCIVVLRSERSLQYWWEDVWKRAVSSGDISRQSIGGLLAETLDDDDRGRCAVQLFAPRAARGLFHRFDAVSVEQHDVSAVTIPPRLRRYAGVIERYAGAQLVVHARKPI